MEEARNGGGKWTELLKAVLASPMGGWLMACIAFSAMAWWIIKDREMVYQDIHSLRDKAMPLITETKSVADEARTISYENNRILGEIRSMMGLPLENRSDLKAIRKQLEKIPKAGEVDNINH